MSDGDDRLDPRLAAALAAARVSIDTAALSARALAAAGPELAARAAFWPRLLRVLGVALMPLPLLVAANVALVAWLYALADAWLPHGVAIYLAASYALAALVGVGLSYASIPLLLARRPPDDALAA
ncbi:hypothetical protein KF840_05860 [bacterium]|nr:hypothetical protein [bacterium]